MNSGTAPGDLTQPLARTDVLLLDSHSETRELIANHINETGDLAVTISVATIAEATDLLDRSRPAIAVVAVTLDDGTAIDFINTLAAKGVDLPTIVLGAGATPTARELLEAGAVAHTYKRVKDFNLIDLIRRHTPNRAD